MFRRYNLEKLITVIITVYNGELYIKKMIESVLNQTYKNLQIICINDGSTDNTLAILDGYDRVITYTTENMGSANARLFGLSKASGDYVIFLDSDDTIDTHMLEKMIKFARATLADMVVCGFYRVTTSNCGSKSSDVEADFSSKEMCSARHDITYKNKIELAYINTSLWNKLIKRTSIPEGIMLPRVTQGDDLAFLLHVYPNVNRVTFIPEPLYNYYVRPNSLMGVQSEDNFRLLIDTLTNIGRGYNARSYSVNDFDPICGMIFVCVTIYLSRFYNSNAGRATIKSLYRYALGAFNKNLNGWRATKCFRYKHAKKHGIGAIGMWAGAVAFKGGFFPLFLSFYCKMKKLFKLSW